MKINIEIEPETVRSFLGSEERMTKALVEAIGKPLGELARKVTRDSAHSRKGISRNENRDQAFLEMEADLREARYRNKALKRGKKALENENKGLQEQFLALKTAQEEIEKELRNRLKDMDKKVKDLQAYVKHLGSSKEDFREWRDNQELDKDKVKVI